MIKAYYNQETNDLEMYQKLIQYWSIMFDRRNNIDVLDNMNFNRAIFPEAIEISEILSISQIEPGYTSPDGYTEMNLLIRELEKRRLQKHGILNKEKIAKIVDRAGIGCGNGCTNVMNAVLNSIIKYKQIHSMYEHGQQEVILILPNYTVYTAQLSNLINVVTPKYVYANRENGFLPLFNQIKNAVTDKTIAVVLTYPNNPAQSTYEGSNVEELQKIAKYCQQQEVFLIVDNIYQDLLYSGNRTFTEIFSLVDSMDYIIKVYGSSKDTPFYSGFRTGYWFGDSRIIDIYKYYISSTENSLNTYSLAQFAFNLYFKCKMMEQKEPVLEDMHFFNQGIFGWNQEVVLESLFHKMNEISLFKKYKTRISESRLIQRTAVEKITEYVQNSEVFDDYVNQNIGNVFFIRVNPTYFNGSSNELFMFLLDNINVGILPGNVFGIKEDCENIWFRITLIHDHYENILLYLEKMEKALLKQIKR